MKVVLKPIRHQVWHTNEIEKPIYEYFRDVLLRPLADLVSDLPANVTGSGAGDRSNDGSQASPPMALMALRKAVESGAVNYSAGVFSGRFSAAISRELTAIGARFNSASRTFRIEPARLPYSARGFLGSAETKAKSIFAAVIALLLLIGEHVDQAPTGINVSATTKRIHANLISQAQNVTAKVSGLHKPTASLGQAEDMAEQLKARLDAFAKKAIKERLRQLRAHLEKLGGRLDRLRGLVRTLDGILRRKSFSIARNETGKLVAAFDRWLASSLGSRSYVWHTMRDWRVRPTPDYPLGDHRSLEGHQYFFASPPVTIPGTGHTANPGEDVECRCRAGIVVEIRT